jgi:hypothetical protein
MHQAIFRWSRLGPKSGQLSRENSDYPEPRWRWVSYLCLMVSDKYNVSIHEQKDKNSRRTVLRGNRRGPTNLLTASFSPTGIKLKGLPTCGRAGWAASSDMLIIIDDGWGSRAGTHPPNIMKSAYGRSNVSVSSGSNRKAQPSSRLKSEAQRECSKHKHFLFHSLTLEFDIRTEFLKIQSPRKRSLMSGNIWIGRRTLRYPFRGFSALQELTNT